MMKATTILILTIASRGKIDPVPSCLAMTTVTTMTVTKTMVLMVVAVIPTTLPVSLLVSCKFRVLVTESHLHDMHVVFHSKVRVLPM